MNKHPTSPQIRYNRKQLVAKTSSNSIWEMINKYNLKYFQGYSIVYSMQTDNTVTFEIYNQNAYWLLSRPKVTAAKYKYVMLAALKRYIAEDKLVWKAATAMAKAMGYNEHDTCPYPFGNIMPPTGVIGMGNGAYIGAVSPEFRTASQWLYPHALTMRAAQRVFDEYKLK